MIEAAIADGRAWAKFRELVEAQGGDTAYIDEPERLPKAALIETVAAQADGYLAHVQADEIGMAVVALGGGREKKGDPIDHAVGVVMHVKVGQAVAVGEPLFTVHANDEAKLREAKQRILAALRFESEPVEPLPLFYDRIVA